MKNEDLKLSGDYTAHRSVAFQIINGTDFELTFDSIDIPENQGQWDGGPVTCAAHTVRLVGNIVTSKALHGVSGDLLYNIVGMSSAKLSISFNNPAVGSNSYTVGISQGYGGYYSGYFDGGGDNATLVIVLCQANWVN